MNPELRGTKRVAVVVTRTVYSRAGRVLIAGGTTGWVSDEDAHLVGRKFGTVMVLPRGLQYRKECPAGYVRRAGQRKPPRTPRG